MIWLAFPFVLFFFYCCCKCWLPMGKKCGIAFLVLSVLTILAAQTSFWFYGAGTTRTGHEGYTFDHSL